MMLHQSQEGNGTIFSRLISSQIIVITATQSIKLMVVFLHKIEHVQKDIFKHVADN